MDGFIEKLKSSSNSLIENEAIGLETFKTLRHTEEDLAKFLRYSIAEVLLSNGNTKVFCTACAPLIKKFVLAKNEEEKKPIPNLSFLRNPNNKIVWDFVKNNTTRIRGKDWQILNFVVVDESNVDILNRTILDLLKNT